MRLQLGWAPSKRVRVASRASCSPRSRSCCGSDHAGAKARTPPAPPPQGLQPAQPLRQLLALSIARAEVGPPDMAVLRQELQLAVQRRVARRLDLMVQGAVLLQPGPKPLDRELLRPAPHAVAEYKVDFGPGYRVYFGQDGPRLVIPLVGGTKKRQARDIQAVKTMGQTTRRGRREGADAAHPFVQGHGPGARAGGPGVPRRAPDGGRQREAGRRPRHRQVVLRDHINATAGFDGLALRTGKPSKSLMRMFEPSGNPAAENLFAVISTAAGVGADFRGAGRLIASA